MNLILENENRSWFSRRYNSSEYILNLKEYKWDPNCSPADVFDYVIVYHDGTSYIIKAKNVKFKYVAEYDNPKILTKEDYELFETNVENVKEVPEYYPRTWKKLWRKIPTGDLIEVASGYLAYKEREDFCMRVDNLTIIGQQVCEEL